MGTDTYISEIINEEFVESRSLLVHLCREGKLREAQNFIHSLENEDLTRRVWAANNLAFIARQQGDYTESLRIHLEIEPLVVECDDFEMKANAYLGMAITLETIAEKEGVGSYFDRALIELEGARIYFELVGNHRFIGGVENNIGYLKIKVGLPQEAREHLQRARLSFLSRDDDDKAYRLAEIDNTEAESYLAENNPQEAIHYSIRSVDALRYGDEPTTLEKSLQTLKVCLQALDDCNRTQLTATALQEAGSVAKAARRLGISRTAVEKRIGQHPELEVYARRGKPRGVSVK